MPLDALLLVLFAALCHTTWNLLLKRGGARLTTQVAALASAVVLTSPVLALYSVRALSATAWALIAASALFETGYVFALTSAYGAGDLSLVYPVARGSATLLVVPLAVALLGERPSPVGLLGIALVVAGVFGSDAALFRAAPGDAGRRRAVRLALVTGTMTAGYSLVNKVGVGLVAVPLYAYLVFAVSAVCAGAVIRARGGAFPVPRRGDWPRIVLMGILMVAAYGAVLSAMSRAAVSYVVAAREIGVVVAALLGALVLGEPHSIRRVVAAVVIFAGLVAIALSR
ncbi:MAG TPA: EamA family transporter [Candidatus Methylomirabilis sp.]|nr:EamA family transporter [Candidatus Methylomirabilis sp.]